MPLRNHTARAVAKHGNENIHKKMGRTVTKKKKSIKLVSLLIQAFEFFLVELCVVALNVVACYEIKRNFD